MCGSFVCFCSYLLQQILTPHFSKLQCWQTFPVLWYFLIYVRQILVFFLLLLKEHFAPVFDQLWWEKSCWCCTNHIHSMAVSCYSGGFGTITCQSLAVQQIPHEAVEDTGQEVGACCSTARTVSSILIGLCFLFQKFVNLWQQPVQYRNT